MEGQLNKTCLHDLHIELGAKMSPFASFDMPISYSGIIDEHNAVRHDVGVFDVSHMGEIFVSGKDAEAFVNHIFTNDVRTLSKGKILYGMMLYPDGGTVDDLLVYKLSEDASSYLLVVNASNIQKDYEWIMDQKGNFSVLVENRSLEWGQIAVQGPNAEKAVCETLGLKEAKALGFYEFTCLKDASNEGEIIVSRTGYTGEDGFEIYASPSLIRSYWKILISSGVKPCGLGCRDTLRFETGLPLYGDELSSDISPVMAGLSMFCKLDKPEFIGKDAVCEQKTNGVKRKLVGIELQDKAIPRAGYTVFDVGGEKEVGVVTTGYHSISLDKSLCFALVDSSYSALDTPLSVAVRRHIFPGKVVKKRFYQTKYKK